MFAFTSTLIATVVFDLTQAIIIGVGFWAVIFVFQISRAKVDLAPVSVEKMRAEGYDRQFEGDRIIVAYIVGPLFFGTVSTFNAAMEHLNGMQDVILSLRTVPLLDTTGISALEDLIERLEHNGSPVYLSGLNEPVRSSLQPAGVTKHLADVHTFCIHFHPIIPTAHH